MRYFYIPFVEKKEDKIIAGKLSLRETGWVVGLPFLFIILLLVINKGYAIPRLNIPSLIIRLVIILMSEIAGVCLAFIRIGEITLDKYLYKKMKFKNREKTFLYRRD